MTCPPFEVPALRGRILVVEEPSVFREMQSLLLRGAGYDVANCDDVTGALLTLSRQEFNVMVVNSDQPAARDPQFLLSVRRDRPRLTLIVATVDVTLELGRQLSQLGIAAVLQRPVNPHTLALKIDEVLGMSLAPGAPFLHEAFPAADSTPDLRAASTRASDDEAATPWREARM